MMKEKWVDIPEYIGKYQVSNLGRIKSLNYNHTGKEQILKLKKSKYGYLQIGFRKNGKRHFYPVHRLVAKAFIKNPESKREVNHIDGNKQNNCVSNLEWCTSSENKKHAFRIGLQKSKKGKDSPCSKRVLQMSLDNKPLKIWDSLSDVERTLKFKKTNISACCLKKKYYNTAYGYKWMFI